MAEGYKAITPIQIANIISAYNSGAVSFRAVRIFLGCLEPIAIREAAKRTSGKSKGARFRPEELERITGLSLTVIKRELRALKRAEVLSFTESAIIITETPLPFAREMVETLSETRKATRLIPIPRSLLIFAAKAQKPALVKTLLGYALRGLSLRKSELRASGSVKAKWLADTLGLSIRSVRAARGELIALGIISEDNSTQHKLNRCGAFFEINAAWKHSGGVSSAEATSKPTKPDSGFLGNGPCGYVGKMTNSQADALRGKQVIHRESQSQPSRAQATALTVDNSAGAGIVRAHKRLETAPLSAQNSPLFAPPYKDLKTSFRTKNQKLENQPSGFCKKINLKNITQEDLTRTSRVLELYAQAVKANWLKASEHNRLRFVAAAIRAKRVGLEPVKVFVSIVRRGLWNHITQAEENQARTALNKLAERKPMIDIDLLIKSVA